MCISLVALIPQWIDDHQRIPGEMSATDSGIGSARGCSAGVSSLNQPECVASVTELQTAGVGFKLAGNSEKFAGISRVRRIFPGRVSEDFFAISLFFCDTDHDHDDVQSVVDVDRVPLL